MAQQQKVYPGEVIRSQFINDLLGRVDDLEARLGSIGGTATGVAVPDVIGQTLGSARSAISTANLTVGTAYNVFGSSITASASSAQGLLVVNQDPVPGARAATGSAVVLILSAEAAGKPTRPEITNTDPASKVPMFGLLAIDGNNFEQKYSDNKVTFNDSVGTSLFMRGQKLYVRVPEMAGTPKTVDVVVTTAEASDPVQLQIIANDPIPQIDKVAPTGGGKTTVDITGRNFGKTDADNIVVVNGVELEVIGVKSSGLNQQLRVQTPESFLRDLRGLGIKNVELVVASNVKAWLCSRSFKKSGGIFG